MRYFWILLLSLSFLFGQNTFTDEEVLGIANQIKELQYSDSTKSVQIEIYEDLIEQYEEHARIDSSLLIQKDEQIAFLMEQNWALEKQTDLTKPRWYENKWLYFAYGSAAIIIPTYFGIKIMDLTQ
jgi:hypothetical protein